MWRVLAAPLLLALLAGCAPASSGSPGEGAAAPAVSRGPSRIVIAIAGDPPGLSTHINPAGTATPGLPELVEMIAPGLSSVDSDGRRVPLLAAELPSTERGSWVVLPDGRMETTWKLRPGVTWHDGAPFTTADLVFTVTASRDPELPEFGSPVFASIDRIETPDPLTITVFWKKPFIDADAMFSPGPGSAPGYAEPMPEHILGSIYGEEKSRVRESPYWT